VSGPVATSFGPSALATPANAVTFARLLCAPALWLLILAAAPSYVVLAIWIVLAATDGVDGYLARRHGTTRSGAFLDPLADKLLVLGALVCLVAEGLAWWVPVAIIAVREVLMSAYRSWLGRRGISLPARQSAKVKTVVQSVAVGVALAPTLEGADWLTSTVLWGAVVLTVWSGAQYLADARRQAVRLAV
jgi:CDP-diacylglycerol---glycerol-3-phosphate 3-phosphatidyltransferase